MEDYKNKKFKYYDNNDDNISDISNISLLFYNENLGMLLSINNNFKYDIPTEKVNKDDKSLIDILVKCFIKKFMLYENIIIQNWFTIYFRDYYVEKYKIEPNMNDFNEWLNNNIERYLGIKNTKYEQNEDEIKMEDIIKNIIQYWIYENKVMIYDVQINKNNKKKNRIYIIDIDNLDDEEFNIMYFYPNFYNYLDNKQKNMYQYMVWTDLMKIREEDCVYNLQKTFDYVYMGVYI